MHEVGIAENVLRIVERTATEHGLATVRRVELSIGRLSGVDAEALEFAFSVIAPGTVLEGAEIQIEVPPILLRCRPCGSSYAAAMEETACPQCGAFDFEITQGRDMTVTSVSGE